MAAAHPQPAIRMQPFAIFLTGRAPDPIRARLGDFDDWFRESLELPADRVRVIDAAGAGPLPDAHALAGAVISGSAAMVTEHLDWSERLAAWIRTAMTARLPLFGVCYGHQLMAYALGGRVDALPGGPEIGTQAIDVLDAGRDDPLLAGLPSRFAGHTTHVQSVLEAPAGARMLARSARDPHQILRYGPHAVSTQLHPEFSAEAMRAYIELRASKLAAEALDVDALLAGVADAPQARSLLRRFAHRADTARNGQLGAMA